MNPIHLLPFCIVAGYFLAWAYVRHVTRWPTDGEPHAKDAPWWTPTIISFTDQPPPPSAPAESRQEQSEAQGVILPDVRQILQGRTPDYRW